MKICKPIKKNKFEGWYFKHQKGNDILSFIPGIAGGKPFIMVLTTSNSYFYDIHKLEIIDNVIFADDCIFSTEEIIIDLSGENNPTIKGRIGYSQLQSLKSHIMGPFRFFKMQCKHGVISMHHKLTGSIQILQNHTLDKHTSHPMIFDLTNGIGYIEKDSGYSFPKSYLWLQCNQFRELSPASSKHPCSIMVSIAHIPFGLTSFWGCICAICYKGKEYRFATYSGVKILAANKKHIRLKQGNMLLEINIKPGNISHNLRSPVKGNMTGMIRENVNATIVCRLWKNQKQVFSLQSEHASFEFVGKSHPSTYHME